MAARKYDNALGRVKTCVVRWVEGALELMYALEVRFIIFLLEYDKKETDFLPMLVLAWR